ncbi:MAG: carbohydrate kinase [Candidatus Marinimicrobia bacterium]|nr:carbohydrate kinase [Candidatus Neomarinimicrobiota bacterium]
MNTPCYDLGLDASTQSLTALILEAEAGRIIATESISYDECGAAHGAQRGVLPQADPQVVHAPPLLWVAALEALFERLKAQGFPLHQVRCISGSGQQHGSVYLNASWPAALRALDPGRPLAPQLGTVFSRPTAPIWMDSSTTAECAEICAALGGPAATAAATGSTTFERFTGPQIRRFYKSDPAGYRQTAHIALVSSFHASLLLGAVAPIDHGDGAGMNLMDIQQRQWLPAALEATAPDLARRLPPLVAPWTILGPISPYFVARYGFDPATRIGVWSGDNPNSIIGLGLTEPGAMAISLGTSDTFFGLISACRTDPRGEGHVFGAPTGDYMTLICFKNGSLARERVRDAYGLDWNGFSAALRATPPGNDGALMLPYFDPEIVPRVLTAGVQRRHLNATEAARNCRAVVECQQLSMRRHARWLHAAPRQIYATGGASINPEILRVMADVHQCPVYRFQVSNSAALGAALRAAHARRQADGAAPDWSALVAPFATPRATDRVEPRPETAPVYAAAEQAFGAFETEYLATLNA